jgi:LacI family transcriptional regulator
MRRRRVLLIVETSLAYGREVLRGISRYAITHGPWSTYLDLRELVVELPTEIEDWEGDGIISRSTSPELAARWRERGIPVVDLTDIHGDLGLVHVWTDHRRVGEMAAEHLLERGFRSLAYCGFSDHNWSHRRLEGFAARLKLQGLTPAEFQTPWKASGPQHWESQQQRLGDWLTSLPRPLGVMACNDLRGQQVLDACRRRFLAVPEEVAVIGVDNDQLLCDICDPPLSSVVPHAERIGYEAAALLDGLMNKEPPLQRILIIEPRGVVTRQSTDVLAIDDPQIATAVSFIRRHACDGITVSEVLEQVTLSRSVLERRFRRFVGKSPQQEIRDVQLKRVKQLLAETDLPLEAIALRTGFAHPEYLSVVFKREIGEPPGEYRRRLKADAVPE